jgi:hypothetical protein
LEYKRNEEIMTELQISQNLYNSKSLKEHADSRSLMESQKDIAMYMSVTTDGVSIGDWIY